MNVHLCRCLLVCAVVVALTSGVTAQETTTKPKRPLTGDRYVDMRESEDRTTQRFAERYFNLVKLQAWTSKDNKSSVNAKYLAHDPDMKWVKLATVKGSGANRVVRDVTVPIDKLNRTCQSRVKQIATLQIKLDELAEGEEENPSTGEGEFGRQSSDYGAPMTDESGAEPQLPDADGSVGERGESREGDSAPGAAASPQVPVMDPADPDPLGFGELPSVAPFAGAPGAGFGDYSNPGGPPSDGTPPSGPVDGTQWQSSYAAFHANFTPSREDRSGQPGVDWGQLHELRAANQIAVNAADMGEADPRRQITEALGQLGEVRWEAGFAGLKRNEGADREVGFNVPPLPEPLELRFVLDAEESAEGWTATPPGQPVRFVGRFDILKPNVITVRIRKTY